MELNKKNIKKIFGIIAASILLYVGLQNSKGVSTLFYSVLALLTPFIIGICIAFILNVPMRFIERHLFYHGKERTRAEKGSSLKERAARPVSLFLTVIFVLGIILIIIFMLKPELEKTFENMFDGIQNFVTGNANTWLDKVVEKFPQVEQYLLKLNIDWHMVERGIKNFLMEGIGGTLDATVKMLGSIVNLVVNFFLGFIFGLYILSSKEVLARQGKKLIYSFFSEKKADRILFTVRLINKTFSNFISGQCLDATILGFMFFVSMSIFRFPYASTLSVLIGFTALIPVFGSFIGCVVATIMILVVSPIQAFWFLVMFLVLQQLEETFVYPNVVGNSVGLPAIWTLAAVVLGGGVMGIAGMLLFIPLLSVIYTLLKETVNIRLNNCEVSPDKWNKIEEFLYPGEEATKKRKFAKIKEKAGEQKNKIGKKFKK